MRVPPKHLRCVHVPGIRIWSSCLRLVSSALAARPRAGERNHFNPDWHCRGARKCRASGAKALGDFGCLDVRAEARTLHAEVCGPKQQAVAQFEEGSPSGAKAPDDFGAFYVRAEARTLHPEACGLKRQAVAQLEEGSASGAKAPGDFGAFYARAEARTLHAEACGLEQEAVAQLEEGSASGAKAPDDFGAS